MAVADDYKARFDWVLVLAEDYCRRIEQHQVVFDLAQSAYCADRHLVVVDADIAAGPPSAGSPFFEIDPERDDQKLFAFADAITLVNLPTLAFAYGDDAVGDVGQHSFDCDEQTCLSRAVVAVEDMAVKSMNYFAVAGLQIQRGRRQPFIHEGGYAARGSGLCFVSVDDVRLHSEHQNYQFDYGGFVVEAELAGHLFFDCLLFAVIMCGICHY